MIDNKKEQERAELHRTIWGIANDLRGSVDVKHFAKVVPNDDIAEQGYNLSVSTYVEQEDTREKVDITELNAEIERIVARSDVLRSEIAVIIAEIEGIEK